MVLFIISAIAAAGLLIYLLYQTITLVRSPMLTVDFKATLKKYGLFAGGFVVSLTLLFISIPLLNNWKLEGWEWLCVVIGGLLASSAAIISLETFIIHYYGKNIPEKLNKWLYRSLVIAFPLLFVFVFLLTNGYAFHMTYPLINGISFSGDAPRPSNNVSPNITFYSLCILSGAIYAYFIGDHEFYKQYGKHGILESTFLVAFPAGIIGARIFYVIGNWNVEFANREFWHVFAIWEGGLTILGGAIMGIGIGVLWFIWRNKGYNIWVAVDLIVPAILLAQAVGRWGNFFNCEVHGVLVDDKYWTWLPLVVFQNAHFSSAHTAAGMVQGQLYVPLFFIECLTNLLGFFVLAHLFGKKLRRFTELGDLGFGYLIWYGLTRTFMEPLRDSNFNMGSKGYWSWFWSLMFIVIGVILIALNHIIRYRLALKKGNYHVKDTAFRNSLIQAGVIVVTSIILLTTAIILMSSSNFTQTISYDKFNVGLIFLVLGISDLILLGVVVPGFIESRKNKVASHA